MKRRLYFLLPDLDHTRAVVEELQQRDIDRRHLHVLAAGNTDLGGLPAASPAQRRDVGRRLERGLWYGNLALFTLALLALIVLVAGGVAWGWWLLPLAVMIGTYEAGWQFVHRVPNVHLDEFHDALEHGEILLMVDVEPRRVAEIGALVHRHHPEAVPGGVGWSTDLLPV